MHDADRAPLPTGRSGAALWDAMIEIDPEESRERRIHQIVYLARYGRQSMLQWDDVPTSLLDELFEGLSDIIKGENPTTRGLTEDH